MKSYVRFLNDDTRRQNKPDFISDVWFPGFEREQVDIEKSDVDTCYYLAGFAPMKTSTEKETETLENDVESIDRKISEIESKLQRSLLDVVIGSIFPLELNADDKKENAESKKYLLQYWKDKKELRRQRIEKLKRIEALKNVISR